MYTIESFYSEIYKLSKSIIYKVQGLDVYLESKLESPDYNKREEYIYYKHITGQKHHTDEDIYINVLELEEKHILTKELLNTYPLTKEELLKLGEFYNLLIETYPKYINYIHGCMYNIDLETALDATDGTILAYNSKFIESQEYDLIPRLEEYIKMFFERWYNVYYVYAEDYYLSSFISVLSANIPLEIINIRLSNLKTDKAHSFFLESYFNSHFTLWDSVSKLKSETIWWLYRNLPVIIKKIGQNENFSKIITKIFEANNVGIGAYNLKYQDSKLNNNIYDYTKLPITESSVVAEIEKLNKTFIETNSIKSVSELLNEELDLSNYTTDRKSFLNESYLKEINNDTNGTVPTKIIEINTLETFNSYNLDPIQLLIDHWAYLLDNGIYGSFKDDTILTAKVEVTDPNTGMYYKITSRTGYYMLLKVLFNVIGKDKEKYKTLIYGNAYDKQIDLDRILNQVLHQDGYFNKYHSYIRDNYPMPATSYTSTVSVSDYMEKVINFTKSLWLLDANSENSIVSANIKNFIYMSLKQSKYDIHNFSVPKTIDELLANDGITFTITENYNHIEMIKELLNKFLGISISNSSELKSLLNVYKDLIRKLTSYTLQCIGDIKSEDTTYIHYNHISPLFSNKGIIKLYNNSAIGLGYEENYFSSNFTNYNIQEEAKGGDFSDKPILDLCTGQHIFGSYYGTITDKIEEYITGARYSLQTLPSKEIDKCDYKTPLLILKEAKYVPEYIHQSNYIDANDNVYTIVQDISSPILELEDVIVDMTDPDNPIITKNLIPDGLFITEVEENNKDLILEFTDAVDLTTYKLTSKN